jgi:hypothetical protein
VKYSIMDYGGSRGLVENEVLFDITFNLVFKLNNFTLILPVLRIV